MELERSTLWPKQRQVGGSQRHLSSWDVPSGQVTLGPDREDNHREGGKEGEGEIVHVA